MGEEVTLYGDLFEKKATFLLWGKRGGKRRKKMKSSECGVWEK